MKEDKTLTKKIAKEILSPFLAKKQSLPPPPDPEEPNPTPLPPEELEILMDPDRFSEDYESGEPESLTEDQERGCGPDLSGFTRIEPGAIGLVREAIAEGLSLWGSPLLYDFLIEPLHLNMVEKLEIKWDGAGDDGYFSYRVFLRSGQSFDYETESPNFIINWGCPEKRQIGEALGVAYTLISLSRGCELDSGSLGILTVEVPIGRITWQFRYREKECLIELLETFRKNNIEKARYELIPCPNGNSSPNDPQRDLRTKFCEDFEFRLKSASFFRNGKWSKRKRKIYKEKLSSLFWRWRFDDEFYTEWGDLDRLVTKLFGPKLEKVKSAVSAKPLTILFETNLGKVQFEYEGEKYVVDDLGQLDPADESQSQVLDQKIINRLEETDPYYDFSLSELSNSEAENLSKFKATLGFWHLTELGDAAAEFFSNHEGGLDFSLTELSDAAIESLSKSKGQLSLGLTELSDAAADSLSKHEGGCLSLHGRLTELSDTAAESLSKYKGDLNLHGLTELSDAAAESLSKHKGDLNLSNLTELSDAAAESLSKHEGGNEYGGPLMQCSLAEKVDQYR